MCHTLLQHYTHCHHSNLAFFTCVPEVHPFRPASSRTIYSHPNYVPCSSSGPPTIHHERDWVPSEWRDHSVPRGIAHSYARLCPGCFEAQAQAQMKSAARKSNTVDAVRREDEAAIMHHANSRVARDAQDAETVRRAVQNGAVRPEVASMLLGDGGQGQQGNGLPNPGTRSAATMGQQADHQRRMLMANGDADTMQWLARQEGNERRDFEREWTGIDRWRLYAGIEPLPAPVLQPPSAADPIQSSGSSSAPLRPAVASESERNVAASAIEELFRFGLRGGEGTRYPRSALRDGGMEHSDVVDIGRQRSVRRRGAERAVSPRTVLGGDADIRGGGTQPAVGTEIMDARERRAALHAEAERRDMQDRRMRILNQLTAEERRSTLSEAAHRETRARLEREVRERREMTEAQERREREEASRRQSERFQQALREERRILDAAAAQNTDPATMQRLQALMRATPVVATLPDHLRGTTPERSLYIGPGPEEENQTQDRVPHQLVETDLVGRRGQLRPPTPDFAVSVEDVDDSALRRLRELGRRANTAVNDARTSMRQGQMVTPTAEPRLHLVRRIPSAMSRDEDADDDDGENDDNEDLPSLVTADSEGGLVRNDEPGSGEGSADDTVESDEGSAASPAREVRVSAPRRPIWHEATYIGMEQGRIAALSQYIECPDHGSHPQTVICSDATHYRKTEHKDRKKNLKTDRQHGDKPQPRDGLKEDLVGETWEIMVLFQACGHAEAVFVEKLKCKHDGTDVRARCGCYGFDRCLVASRRASSLERCLTCRMKREKARLEAIMREDGEVLPWFELYARNVRLVRELNMWPMTARDGN